MEILSKREEELVRLLLDGHTDTSAARRLRVSPRTVTTILRGLMDRLSVNSRFQLGVSLGRQMALGDPTVASGHPTVASGHRTVASGHATVASGQSGQQQVSDVEGAAVRRPVRTG